VLSEKLVKENDSKMTTKPKKRINKKLTKQKYLRDFSSLAKLSGNTNTV